MAVVTNKNLTRNSDNTIQVDTAYYDLNTKANNLTEDLVNFVEDIADDVEAYVPTQVNSLFDQELGATYYNKTEIDSMLENTKDSIYATIGTQGFGVGVCPPDELPIGMNGLSGYMDRTSDNYGNYKYSDGSIMVFIPKFYYRINHVDNPTHTEYSPNDIHIVFADTFDSEAAANLMGYALHRAFIDGGEVKSGFFVDKYMCSKNALGTGYVASSIAGGAPISTAAYHNPISELTACSGNYYYECITAAHARDGENGEVNPASEFFCNSRFIQSALALISLAHGQASTSATYCAWYDATYNYPKGCNNNALRDADDTSVLYTTDGYSNCGLTGSGQDFNKTTHNGQACGVSDLNGLMYEVNTGFCTDSVYSNFYVLKESSKISTLTSGTGGLATDHWGSDEHLSSNFDLTDIAYIEADATYRFGNDGYQTISEETDRTSLGYKLAGLGFPKDADGRSANGTNLYGRDYFREYRRTYLCLLSCSFWSYGSSAGVFACVLGNTRYNSYHNVGFRCACYPV